MKKPQNHDIVRGVLCRKFRSMVRTSTKWTKVAFLLSHGLCESGKQIWLNWVLWVWAFDKVGLQSHPETYMGTDPPVSTLTSMIVDRIQLLKIATLSVSTAQGHLSRPLHRVAHNMVADFQRQEQSRAREGQQAGLKKNISVSHWHLIEVRMWSQSISKHIWARLKGEKRNGAVPGRENAPHWSQATREVLKNYFASNLILFIWVMTGITLQTVPQTKKYFI